MMPRNAAHKENERAARENRRHAIGGSCVQERQKQTAETSTRRPAENVSPNEESGVVAVLITAFGTKSKIRGQARQGELPSGP